MVGTLHEWNLYNHTSLKEHCQNYKLLKDVLHNPIHQTLDHQRKLKCGIFLEGSLDHIIHLQTQVKQNEEHTRTVTLQSIFDRES